MANRKYDVIYALMPQTDNEKIDALISKIEKKITSLGGIVISSSKKGILKIATRIRKHKNIKDGFFVAMVYEGPSNIAKEIENILKLSENVVRHIITIKKEPLPQQEEKAKTEDVPVEINPEMLVGKPE